MIFTKNPGDQADTRLRPPEVAGTAARGARAATVALACCAVLGTALAAPVKHAPAKRAPARVASKNTHPATRTAPGATAKAAAAPSRTAAATASSASPSDGSPIPLRPPTYPAFSAAAATATTAAVATPAATAVALAGPAAAASGPSDTAGNMVRYLDQRGLLDPVNSVASRSTELFAQVRDRTTSLVTSAMNFLGVPYKHGGSSVETGFDCSGFTRHVFENSIGLLLPHRADEQAKDPSLLKVDLKDLKPGDLVFFNTMRRTFSHVGIYLGEGMFIHSPRTGESVRVEDMRISYWARRFTGARRVPALDATSATPTAAMLTANLNASVAPSLTPVAGTIAPSPSGTASLLAVTGAETPRAGPVAGLRPTANGTASAVAPHSLGIGTAAATLAPPLDARVAPPLGER